jgi:CTP:phosphocholine cytidylyltransferase-like protein
MFVDKPLRDLEIVVNGKYETINDIYIFFCSVDLMSDATGATRTNNYGHIF